MLREKELRQAITGPLMTVLISSGILPSLAEDIASEMADKEIEKLKGKQQ